MASAWAQLSKEEQLAASEKGYVKKSYNDESKELFKENKKEEIIKDAKIEDNEKQKDDNESKTEVNLDEDKTKKFSLRKNKNEN